MIFFFSFFGCQRHGVKHTGARQKHTLQCSHEEVTVPRVISMLRATLYVKYRRHRSSGEQQCLVKSSSVVLSQGTRMASCGRARLFFGRATGLAGVPGPGSQEKFVRTDDHVWGEAWP